MILKKLIKNFMNNRLKAIKKDAFDGLAMQNIFLKDILSINQGTQYGKKYSFSKISTSNEAFVNFRYAVPIVKYSDIESFIRPMMRGDQNVLTSQNLILFNLTSGTTSAAKFIPVTKQSSVLAKSLLNSWVASAYLDYPNFLDGHRLALPGSAIDGYTESGIPFGSATGQAYREAPWAIRRKYAVPAEVFDLKDYDLRYFIVLLYSLSKDLSFVITPNMGTLIRLAEVAEENAQSLVKAIYDGKLPNYFEKKIQLNRKFSNKKRARFLDRLLNSGEKFQPRNYWKNIQLIGTWLGGSSGFQADRLREIYGSVPFRELGYHASEGRMSLPLYSESANGLLAIRNNFFEFIHRDEYEKGLRETKLMNELSVGEEYYVIVTNCNGLYRYDMEDIVKVSDYIGLTPVIAFCRKGRDMLNISGEKIHINHLLNTYQTIQSKFQLNEDRFVVIPDYVNLRYNIYLEMDEGSYTNKLIFIADEWESALFSVNYEYKAKRQSSRLNQMKIIPIKIGTIPTRVTEYFRLGTRDVQYKWTFFLKEESEWLKDAIIGG